MLEQNDLQAIGILLDQRFKVQDKKFDKKLDQRFDEMISAVNDGFTGMQGEIDGLKKEMTKRPTKAEIFGWADERIVDLELAKDRHDFMHLNELDKLPPQAEISRALAERGFKRKIV